MTTEDTRDLHLWKVVVSYRYASEKNLAVLFVVAGDINSAGSIALREYDILSQDWPANQEPFVRSARLVSWYISMDGGIVE